MKHLVIAGGGITGLATAYLSAQAGMRVTVLESAAQFGGLLGTFPIAGTRLEHYYHHFFTHDAEINWLIGELGISEKLFFKKTSMGVYRKGKIYPFNSPLDLLQFSPISWPDKVRFGLSSLYLGKIARWGAFEQVAALDWFYRYAGHTSTESLWKPMLQIKFGSYASKIPLAWMVGRLRQRMKSRKNGEERLGYLNGSLDTLLQALLQALAQKGVELVANTPVQGLEVKDGKVVALETSNGRVEGDVFLLTQPSIHLPALLATHAPSYAKQLESVKYFGAVCTVLEMDRPLSEIYWLNIADEGYPFGGVIEHTNFVPTAVYGGSHIAYLSRYYTWEEPLASMGEEDIKALMLEGVKRLYPRFSESHLKSVRIFRSRTAATVCDLGFSSKIPSCQSPLAGLYVANMCHVYPDERSVNNSIRVAASACNTMGISHQVPANASMAGQIGFSAVSN